MKVEFVPRVNQIDVLQLDKDIIKIIRDQLSKALQNLSPGLLSVYQPEFDLLLRSALWYYSIQLNLSTFGQQLLFICYDRDQLRKVKIFYHYFFTVLIKYLKDNALYRYTNNQLLQSIVKLTDNFLTIIELINTFRFLKTGKKPTFIDYILGLDYISLYGNKRRDVGYSYMNRELIWGGFMELLGFTLPLINYHALKRNLRNLVSKSKQNIQTKLSINKYALQPKLTIETKCAYCNERPTLPHTMGCKHIFCYYCLQGNFIADSNFQCPICDWSFYQLSSIIS